MWKRLLQTFSANNGTTILKTSAAMLAAAKVALSIGVLAQGQPVLQVRADAHGAEGHGGCVSRHSENTVILLKSG